MKPKWMCAGLAVGMLAAGMAGAEVKIVSGEVPPYSFPDGTQGRGVVYEVVRELAKRVGHSGQIQFLPWRRAQTMAQEEPNVMILPLSRTPSREQQYSWVVDIFGDDFVLAGRKSTTVDLSSADAIKALRIGFLLGSPAEKLVADNQLTKVEGVPTEEVNAKKLAADRIDGWLTAKTVATWSYRRAGLDPADLRWGRQFMTIRLYLAGSPNLDPKEIEQWKAAFETMKKDGSYQKIVNAYK